MTRLQITETGRRGSRDGANSDIGDSPAAPSSRHEGIVSKRKDAPYRSGRSLDWLKSKNAREAV